MKVKELIEKLEYLERHEDEVYVQVIKENGKVDFYTNDYRSLDPIKTIAKWDERIVMFEVRKVNRENKI